MQTLSEKIERYFKCTILFWIAVPFFLPLLFWLYTYRAFVILLQKLVHPRWIEILSPRDMTFSEDMTKPHLLCNVCLILTFEGQVDLEKFRHHFMDKVLKYQNPQGKRSYARFEQYFENWMGFPFWKKERRFDIKQHIRILTLDKKEQEKETSEMVTEEQLHKLMQDKLSRRFKSQTSPWEILIVPKYQSKIHTNCENVQGEASEKSSRFAVVLRFHHILFDGYSYNSLLLERMCGQSMTLNTTENSKKIIQKSILRRIFSSLWLFTEILLNLGMYHAQFFFLDRDVNIWHNKGQTGKKLTGKVHTAKCQGVPFSVTRNVSKKLRVAPTATMFSCVAGGIRKYFEMKQLEIPQQMTAFFSWPVKNHPMTGLVNHWSFVDIALPTGESDRLTRINKTNAKYQALKKSPVPKLMWNFSPFFSAVPSPFFDIWGWNRKSTLSISNFPGPNMSGTQGLYLFGKWKFVENTGFTCRLRGDTAAQLALYTDNGDIHVTVTADRGILSEEDAKLLAQFIQEEFKYLEILCYETNVQF